MCRKQAARSGCRLSEPHHGCEVYRKSTFMMMAITHVGSHHPARNDRLYSGQGSSTQGPAVRGRPSAICSKTQGSAISTTMQRWIAAIEDLECSEEQHSEWTRSIKAQCLG